VVETAMWRENLEKPGVSDAVLGLIPTRRLSTPEEVADRVTVSAAAVTG
jgi:hypothetical protein